MNSITITQTVDISVPDYEVEVEVDPEEVLDEVGLSDCLDHFDDPTEVMHWLVASAEASDIGEWIARSASLKTACLTEIGNDDDGRAAAIELLGGASGQPKLTDGDLALISTALGSIAAECEHIAGCAAMGSVREAFSESAAAYRAVRAKLES